MTKKDKTKMTKELVGIVSHPEFEKFILELENQPEDKRMSYAIKMSTLKEMKKRGIPVTKDFRITPRIFEGKNISPEFGTYGGRPQKPPTPITICASLGYVVCVSVGQTI